MLPRIDITQNLGRLAVRSERAVLRINEDVTDLKMNNTQVKVEISGDFPRVEIDQTGSFASAGLKKPIPQYMDFVRKCKQESIAVIGKIAGEGYEFVQIENPNNDRVVQQQSRRVGQKDPSLTLVAMPSVRPEIKAVLGDATSTFHMGDTGTRWDRAEKPGTYVPSKTYVSWLEKPDINISVAEFDVLV